MPFTIDGVVPWGRTMDEYCGMFDLGERELRGRILGCGDGPASFNAEMTAQGVQGGLGRSSVRVCGGGD